MTSSRTFAYRLSQAHKVESNRRVLHARGLVEDVVPHGADGHRSLGLDAVLEVVTVGGRVSDLAEGLLHS